MLSCPSTFPAFAEAFCSIGGLFVEAISEQWNQLRFIEPPDFCATQELALRVSHICDLDGQREARIDTNRHSPGKIGEQPLPAAQRNALAYEVAAFSMHVSSSKI